MAKMIPDEMPVGSSKGEKIVFDILQNLPNNYTVFYEPNIVNRHPDFVVICPDLGVMIIEVKSWDLFSLIRADMSEIIFYDGKEEKRDYHPLKQACSYRNKLMTAIRNHKKGPILLHQKGKWEGYFILPFGHMGVLSNITRDELRQFQDGQLMEIFPESCVATRDEIDEWRSLNEKQIKAKLKSYFNPVWTIDCLNQEQKKNH